MADWGQTAFDTPAISSAFPPLPYGAQMPVRQTSLRPESGWNATDTNWKTSGNDWKSNDNGWNISGRDWSVKYESWNADSNKWGVGHEMSAPGTNWQATDNNVAHHTPHKRQPSIGSAPLSGPRAPSQVSNRGRGKPRQNSNRPALVPAQVQIKQAQNTLNAAKADLKKKPNQRNVIHSDTQPTSEKTFHSNDRRASLSQQMNKNKRQTKWASHADIKAATKVESAAEQERAQEDVVEIASAQADAGDVHGKIFRPIQPGQDASLDIREWDGSWAPAPADWEERPMFMGTPSVTKVMEWHDGYDDTLTTTVKLPSAEEPEEIPCRHVRIPTNDEFTRGGGMAGEICPHDWVVEEIDAGPQLGTMMPFTAWWANMQKFPVAGDVARDTDDASKPYWERYTGWDHDQLTPLQVPEAKIDPADNDIARVLEQTSIMTIANKGNEQLRKVSKVKKDKKEALQRQREMESYVPAPNEYSPQVNIYLRPAELSDVPSIQEIYNYWVNNSIFAPDMQAVNRGWLESALNEAREDNLPFIVAVDRSTMKKANIRGPRGRQQTQVERIIGYVIAEDWQTADSMYRYAVELECYVRPEYLRKGVGRTLMDKMISILDTGYASVGGYEFVCGNDSMKNKYITGGMRVVDQLIVNISHNSEDKSKLDWNAEWLKRRWGFKQKGYLDEIGRKLTTKYVKKMLLLRSTANNALGSTSPSTPTRQPMASGKSLSDEAWSPANRRVGDSAWCSGTYSESNMSNGQDSAQSCESLRRDCVVSKVL